jgi:hypothetical protein
MKIALSLILILIANEANAVKLFLSGNELLGMLEPARRESGAGAYYVMGVIDGFNGDRVCIPKHGSGSQAAQMVFFYLKDHEEIRKYSAATVVNDALSKEWPCIKSKEDMKFNAISEAVHDADKQEAKENPALFAEHEARREREYDALKKGCFDDKTKPECTPYLDLLGK